MATINFYTNRGRIRGQRIVGSTRQAYVSDAQGSVIGTLSSSGKPNRASYTPYGIGNPPGQATLGWLGTLGYRPTGLPEATYYVRARHYSSTRGRWTSADPAMERFDSGYQYALSSPVTRLDWTGLASSCGTNLTDDCKKPVRQPGCCKPTVGCLPKKSHADYFGIRIDFVMDYYAGNLSATIVYKVKWKKGANCPTCPPDEEIPLSVSTNDWHSGQKSNGRQDADGWCYYGGPIPPSDSIAASGESYTLDTSCNPPDSKQMEVPPEGFKFRINGGGKVHPKPCPKGSDGVRDHLAIHPDGYKGKPYSSIGCIVSTNIGSLRTFRSCMENANTGGCTSIPLNVTLVNI